MLETINIPREVRRSGVYTSDWWTWPAGGLSSRLTLDIDESLTVDPAVHLLLALERRNADGRSRVVDQMMMFAGNPGLAGRFLLDGKYHPPYREGEIVTAFAVKDGQFDSLAGKEFRLALIVFPDVECECGAILEVTVGDAQEIEAVRQKLVEADAARSSVKLLIENARADTER
jgi:hypothetical protein